MRPSTGAPLGRPGRLLCLAFVTAVGIPLFILPAHQTTNLTKIFDPSAAASVDPQPLEIHWIVLMAGLVAAYLAGRPLFRGRFPLPPGARLVGGLGLAFFIALIAGLIVSPRPLSVVYFVQTCIPLVGFLVGSYLVDSVSSVRKIALLLVTVTTISITLILILAVHYGALSSGWDSLRSLAKAIPQLRGHFPYIVAASLSMALGTFELVRGRWNKGLLLMAILIHLLFYSLTWSRTAVLMLGVVAITPVLLVLRSTSRRALIARVVVAGALLAGGVVLLSQYSALAKRWQLRGFGSTDSRRVEYAVTSVKKIAGNPLFGRMFLADWEQNPLEDEPLRVPRIYKAHNQYLDYGVRAGLPAMILLGWIILRVGRDLRLILKSSATVPEMRPLAVGVTGALLAAAFGGLFQLILVQAQTGSLAWLLVGVTFSLADVVRSSGSESIAIDHGA
ncbi:MAG: O-antigen ligase family protein [bacterium]|nr:O-antigen ligase family protein [bacterium]